LQRKTFGSFDELSALDSVPVVPQVMKNVPPHPPVHCTCLPDVLATITAASSVDVSLLVHAIELTSDVTPSSVSVATELLIAGTPTLTTVNNTLLTSQSLLFQQILLLLLIW
jgi:hypothetical protein